MNMPIPGSTFTKEGLGLRRWEKMVEDSYINVLAFMKDSEYRFPTLSQVMQRRLAAGENQEKYKAWWDYPILVSLGAVITADQIAFDPYCSVLEKLMDSPRFDVLCQADPLHTQSDFQKRFDELFEAKQQPLASKDDFNRLEKKYPLRELEQRKYTLGSLFDSFWPGLVDGERHFLRKYAEAVQQQKTFKDSPTAMGLEISYAYLSKPVGYALCSLEQGFSGSNLMLQGIDAQYLRLYSGSMLLTRPPSWWEYVLWG